LLPFHYDTSISIRFGPGVSRDIGDVIDAMACRRILVVTDPNVRRIEPVARVFETLAVDRETEFFDAVHPNPTARLIEQGAEVARVFDPDVIVGVGGGSALDCAKGINFLLTNGGRIEDYQGFGKASAPMLLAVGIPTTAGTGSEAQSYALISKSDTHEKMACGDRKARFELVLLDPELIATTPSEVRASTGLDAIAHALESYVTRTRNRISRMLSREAWHLLNGAFERYHADPSDVGAAGEMLVGAHLAGAAIEASMLGAAHACANPLTARFDIAHGAAVALMLPHVMAHNARNDPSLYEGLRVPADAIEERVVALRSLAGLPERLEACGVGQKDLSVLANEAHAQWTGAHNPFVLSVEEYETLYAVAL